MCPVYWDHCNYPITMESKTQRCYLQSRREGNCWFLDVFYLIHRSLDTLNIPPKPKTFSKWIKQNTHNSLSINCGIGHFEGNIFVFSSYKSMLLSSSVSWYCVDPWENQQVNGIDKIRQTLYFCVKLIDMWHAVNWQFSWIVLCTKYLLSKFLCRLIMCLYQHNLKKWSIKSFYRVWFDRDLSIHM